MLLLDNSRLVARLLLLDDLRLVARPTALLLDYWLLITLWLTALLLRTPLDHNRILILPTSLLAIVTLFIAALNEVVISIS